MKGLKALAIWLVLSLAAAFSYGQQDSFCDSTQTVPGIPVGHYCCPRSCEGHCGGVGCGATKDCCTHSFPIDSFCFGSMPPCLIAEADFLIGPQAAIQHKSDGPSRKVDDQGNITAEHGHQQTLVFYALGPSTQSPSWTWCQFRVLLTESSASCPQMPPAGATDILSTASGPLKGYLRYIEQYDCTLLQFVDDTWGQRDVTDEKWCYWIGVKPAGSQEETCTHWSDPKIYNGPPHEPPPRSPTTGGHHRESNRGKACEPS